jgi:class I fructose-bisphosphate aldolase/fructose-bisphosphate aldolase/2-amino-3,7-dideoxy-D-threo-hept-6-ulosonate synthase
MTHMARQRRWNRFLDPKSGKALIVPIDHGLTLGPIEGLGSPGDILDWFPPDVATGVILHKGMAERLGGVPGCGMMLHLNGALNVDATPDLKVMLTSVDAAVRLGADAVSVQVNFSREHASHNLRMLGAVVDDAHALGLPVLAMVYDKLDASGPNLVSLRHFMRVAVELGVDALKILPPSNLDLMPELIYGVQEHTPVLLAGGPLTGEDELLQLGRAVVAAGAGGLCVGRNLFQRPDPRGTMERLLACLRQAPRADVADVLRTLVPDPAAG